MLWEQGEQAGSEGSKLGARGVSWGLPEALGGLGPWERAGVNWSLGRPWEASGLGSELEQTGASGGLGRPWEA